MMNKIKFILEKIDIYGQEAKLNTLGKEKFKTCTGGLLSLVSFCCLMTGTFLFGADFFFKTNPRIISQEKFPAKPEFVYPTNQNFTISYVLEDGDAVKQDPEKIKVGFYAEYMYYARNQENQFDTMFTHKIASVPCSETSAVENPDMAHVNLLNWYCIDWDVIQQIGRERLKDKAGGSDFRPILGGSWSGDEIAFIGISFGNFIEKDGQIAVTSYKEARESLTNDVYYASINFPSFSFSADSEDRPFNVFYENFFYELNPNLMTTHRNFFKIGKLVDDKGWIFKDEFDYFATTFSFRQSEFGLVNKEADDRVDRTFYSFLLYFENKQLNYRRNYMKIQELGAIVGGFIKFINLVLAGSYSYLNSHYRDVFFFNRFYTVSESNSILLPNNALFENKTVKVPAEEQYTQGNKRINIGFLKHLCARVFSKNKQLIKEYQMFEKTRKEIWSKIDADFILRHFNQFDELKRMLLTETQMKDLERDRLTVIG